MGASTLQQHAASFLSRVGTTYGDTTLKEFDDPVLQEHVDSIALCDAKVHSMLHTHTHTHTLPLHHHEPVRSTLF